MKAKRCNSVWICGLYVSEQFYNKSWLSWTETGVSVIMMLVL